MLQTSDGRQKLQVRNRVILAVANKLVVLLLGLILVAVVIEVMLCKNGVYISLNDKYVKALQQCFVIFLLILF